MKKVSRKYMLILLLVLLTETVVASLNLPGSVLRAVVKTQNYLKKNDLIKAEETLLRHIERNSRKHFIVHFLLGNIYAKKNQTDKAVNQYIISSKLNGKYAPTFKNLGTIFFKQKKYSLAGDTLLKSFQLSEEKDYNNLYFASISYIHAKKYKIAKDHLFFLISGKAGPPKSEWLKAALNLSIKLGLYTEAEGLIEKLILIEKNDSKLWRLITWFHLNRKQYYKALTAFKIYSYLAPLKKDADIKLLGDLYSSVGLTDLAAGCYEKMDKKDYKKIVEAYINSSRKDKAVIAANSALEKKCDPEICFLKGVLHFEKYEYEKAFKSFSRCTELTQKNGRAFLLSGYCAIQTGRFKEAEIALKKAMKFESEKKRAIELMEYFKSKK